MKLFIALITILIIPLGHSMRTDLSKSLRKNLKPVTEKNTKNNDNPVGGSQSLKTFKSKKGSGPSLSRKDRNNMQKRCQELCERDCKDKYGRCKEAKIRIKDEIYIYCDWKCEKMSEIPISIEEKLPF